MRLTTIKNELALKIITEGEPKSFTVFEYLGTNYTIFHRNFNGKHYDILELVGYDEANKKEISEFRLCDSEELKSLFGGR